MYATLMDLMAMLSKEVFDLKFTMVELQVSAVSPFSSQECAFDALASRSSDFD